MGGEEPTVFLPLLQAVYRLVPYPTICLSRSLLDLENKDS
jgi:hypothetical protein